METILLEVNLLDIESGMSDVFPAYTRYSPDGGYSWYMLYFGGNVHIDESDLWKLNAIGQCILFDFSKTTASGFHALCIQAMAYAPDGGHLGSIETYSTDGYLSSIYTGSEEAVPILNTGNVAVFSERVTDGSRYYTLEQLVQRADGTAAYRTVSDNSISVQFGSNNVVLAVGDVLPEAGTYRLRTEYYFNGICYARSTHAFFVNYSAETEY